MAVRRGVLAALLVATFLVAASGPLTAAEIEAIRLYQRIGSPVTARVAACRFDPTCSHFALAALERRGFWRGNWRIAGRLALCSPLGALWDWASGQRTADSG